MRAAVLVCLCFIVRGCVMVEVHTCPLFKGHSESGIALLDEINRLRMERGLKPLEHSHSLCAVAYCYGDLLNRERRYECRTGENLDTTVEWLKMHKIEFEEVYEYRAYLSATLQPEEVVSKFGSDAFCSGKWVKIGVARHG